VSASPLTASYKIFYVAAKLCLDV